MNNSTNNNVDDNTSKQFPDQTTEGVVQIISAADFLAGIEGVQEISGLCFESLAANARILRGENSTTQPGQRHRFGSVNLDGPIVLLIVNAMRNTWKYAVCSREEQPSATRISFAIQSAGSIASIGEDKMLITSNAYTDYYVPTVIFDSDHLMTPGLNEIYGWDCNDEILELNDLFLEMQNWVFDSR